MKRLTVFTPAYNRGYTLSRLYKSLVAQTNLDFEWLIIDDGSTDNTRQLVDTFQKENKITICYYYNTNGGKQRAINKGVGLAKGDLFFIVDSDDYLTNDALEKVWDEWEKIPQKEKYAGLCFRKIVVPAMTILGNPFPCERFDSDSLELTYKYKGNVDKAEVFRTDVLKQFPFPEIEGENFVPEALIWYRIAASGLKLRCVDEGIYMCEYLPDGLTYNFNSNLKKNNRGFALFYKEILRYSQPDFYPDKLKALVRLLQCKLYQLLR